MACGLCLIGSQAIFLSIMLGQLIKLPGNILRGIVGILPHDDAESGTTKGYKEGENGHFKEWCEAMGGKVVGPGLCSMQVDETQYKQLHNQLYQPGQQSPAEVPSEFVRKYQEYMGGQGQ
jgi:hypothetical protein